MKGSDTVDTTKQMPESLRRQIDLRNQMRAMSPNEARARCARTVFRAQTEREPTPSELTTFLASGDYTRALDDPCTFERLEGQATKAGGTEYAAFWRTLADQARHGDAQVIEHAILWGVLTFEQRGN